MREPPGIAVGNRREPQAVRRLAGGQDGIVTRAQLLSAGVSGSMIDRALRSGWLHRLHRGVYATVAPQLITEDGLLIAALFAAGDGAVLSHGTAAWRWRIIPAPPAAIELTVPWRRPRPSGVVLREGALRPGDMSRNRGLPTTSVPRTLLDLAARYTHAALLRALAEAEFHHDLRPPEIEATLRRGHPGSAHLRNALKAHTPGHGQVKSNLERRFRALLVRRGVELPLRNQPLGPWTVDCLWPDRRVAVELDGRQHERPRQADEDDDRDLWLRRNRYIARRYGQRQIDDQPDAVVADLQAAFDEAIALGYESAAAASRASHSSMRRRAMA